MIVEVRYTRSFLHDLKSLETSAYERVYNFIFYEFPHHWQMRSLPQMRQLDSDGIFHRFSIDNYLIGIEVRGEIVKFLRVIPMPDV